MATWAVNVGRVFVAAVPKISPLPADGGAEGRPTGGTCDYSGRRGGRAGGLPYHHAK